MQTLWVDPYNGLKTHRNDIIFDRGMSFEAACRKLEHEKGADDASSFRRSRRPIFGRTMFLLALQKVGTPGVFTICRPNTGTSFFDMEVMTIPPPLPAWRPRAPGARRAVSSHGKAVVALFWGSVGPVAAPIWHVVHLCCACSWCNQQSKLGFAIMPIEQSTAGKAPLA